MVAIALISGCNTPASYRPLTLDSKTGMYATNDVVAPAEIQTYDTGTNPKVFPVVLMDTGISGDFFTFNFKVRSVLAQAGITQVLSPVEFRRLAKDKNIEFGKGVLGPDEIRQFSTAVAPVLVVTVISMPSGVHGHALVRVVDGRSNTMLLNVLHEGLVISDYEKESIYPVLNILRKWILDASKGAAA